MVLFPFPFPPTLFPASRLPPRAASGGATLFSPLSSLLSPSFRLGLYHWAFLLVLCASNLLYVWGVASLVG